MKKSFRVPFQFAKDIVLVVFVSAGLHASAQQMQQGSPDKSGQVMQPLTYNFTSLTPQPSYKNFEKLNSVNSAAARKNPDFGQVAPNVNDSWYEQYDKRTATERSFVTEDGAIVNGFSYIPVNYVDKSGNYVAINPRLAVASNGWSAPKQEFPTFLHPDGSTEISLSENDHLKFNFNSSIAGNSISVNNFTVGDNGMLIHNAIDGVDKKIIFLQNRIETDYVLNKPLKGIAGDLVISEEIILPEGYSLKDKKKISFQSAVRNLQFANSTEAYSKASADYSEIIVVNASGEECAYFKMPVYYDSNRDKSKREQSHCHGKYQIRIVDGKTFLDIDVPSAWINDAARVYPVTIDPVVTGPMALWAGGVINSCYSPSFNTAIINVTVPANVTITNFLITSSYYADPTTLTYESDGLMYFTTSCGRDPLNALYYYTVMSPGGDVSGTAYLNKQDMGATEAFCLSPSCSPQTIALTMNLSRNWDYFGTDFACSPYEIRYDPATLYPFEAYIVGKSVELAGGANSWTITPGTLCSNTCQATLNANVSGGVPPYTMTHPWTGGSTTFGSHIANTSNSSGTGTLTLNIPGCPSTCGTVASLSVPSPLIIDACGDTVSGVTTKNVSQNPVPIVTPNPASANVCSGGSVSITNSSCVAGSIITWTGSNGSSGSGNIADNPVNNGAIPITVNYTVNVTANGCSGTSVVVPVTVNPGGFIITIAPASPSICPGDTAHLTASGASTYIWSPGNGLSSTSGATVSANPVTTTIYTVKGTDGNGCTSTSNVTVSLRNRPAISVNPPSASICPGNYVKLTASGANTYTWSPTNGLAIGAIGDTVDASPSSQYIYTVAGKDAFGCTNSVNVTVGIYAAPTVSVNPPSPGYCSGQGQSVVLTASGVSTNNYSWSPASYLSNASGAIVTANPTTTVTYYVTGTDGNGCTGIANVTVTVNQPPAIIITSDPPTGIVCSGQPATLTAAGGNTYTWNPSTGLSSTIGTVVSANPAATITYTVTGTDVNGCTNTTTSTLTVNTSFAIDAGQDANICTNGSTQITVAGAPPGSTYTWTPSINLSCNCATPVADPSSTTTYIVNATSPEGCSGTDTITIIVTPLAATAGQQDTLVCAGSPVHFNASGGDTYVWSPATGLSNPNIPNPTAMDTAGTTYTVTVSRGNCSSTATVTVNTFPTLPTPQITLKGNDTLICSINPQYTAYQWYDVNGVIAGATDTIYIAPESGNYNVAVQDENGCFISVGINIIINSVPHYGASDNSIYLYPNPATNQLFIFRGAGFLTQNSAVTIFNLLGEKMISFTMDESRAGAINIKTLASGIYFLQLQSPERKWIGKFVKE